MIVCIDPAVSPAGGTGLAWFTEGGALYHAMLLRPVRGVPDVAERIRATLDSVDLFRQSTPALCLVEWPQIYADSPVNPNHLLGLAGVAMAIVMQIKPSHVHSVLPREWKGTLDGAVMAARIEGRLTPEEIARIEPCPKSLRHNVLDSIGIGLWYFKRLDRKRVFRR